MIDEDVDLITTNSAFTWQTSSNKITLPDQSYVKELVEDLSIGHRSQQQLQ